MMMGYFLLVVAATIGLAISGQSPILLVPGWTDSQLEGRISDGSSCDTGGKWLSYWVNPDMPGECVNKVLMLEYDSTTNTYSNLPGVEVRVPGFGETYIVEYKDRNKTIPGGLNVMVEYFASKGYERGKMLRAAPYDWRLAGDTLKSIGYYQSMKNLVEEMYNTARNEKVSIVVHSMGGPVTLNFLNIVSQDWKDKYIKAFIPLAGAWSGGNSALTLLFSGTMPTGEDIPFGESFQSLESVAWLHPNPSVWKDRVILTTEEHNYTANDYKKLFDSIQRSADYDKFGQVLSSNGDYPAPEVPTYCFYGTGVPTPEVINYGHSFPEQVQSVVNGDGDGVVNLLSSEVCLNWATQRAPFKAQAFDQVDHDNIVENTIVLNAVADAMQLDTSNHHPDEL